MESWIGDFAAFVQVVLIDLALAGDNAIAVGLAASALAKEDQRRVIMIGIGLALVLRILFALVTVQLLAIKGLLLAGGLLLFWVAWRMWRDMQKHQEENPPVEAAETATKVAGVSGAPIQSKGAFGRALTSIIIADVSMSLDNVLAVAGVARHAPTVMVFGLVLAVVLMGAAASVIARVIERFRWIATVGIVVIVIAATRMVWEDLHSLLPAYVPAIPTWLGGHHAVEAGLRGFLAPFGLA